MRSVLLSATVLMLAACGSKPAARETQTSNAIQTAKPQPKAVVRAAPTIAQKALYVSFCMHTGECAIRATPVTYGGYEALEFTSVNSDGRIERLMTTENDIGMVMFRLEPNGCVYSIIDFNLDGTPDNAVLHRGSKQKCLKNVTYQSIYHSMIEFMVLAIKTAESERNHSQPDTPVETQSEPVPHTIV